MAVDVACLIMRALIPKQDSDTDTSEFASPQEFVRHFLGDQTPDKAEIRYILKGPHEVPISPELIKLLEEAGAEEELRSPPDPE